MESSNSNLEDFNKKTNNIKNFFPIIKNKLFNDTFDSFIFGYILGNILKDYNKPLNMKLIEDLYIEYQKNNKLPFEKIYQNLHYYLFCKNISKIDLNLKKEDSDNFNLFTDDDNDNDNNIININNNIININSIDNYEQKDINKKEQPKIINSIIGPEDYEDYEEDESEKKGKCGICLEEYEYANPDNYYLDCCCIIHSPCFDAYIENAINSGKVPIKCPYCNKMDINEIDVKESLTKNNKIDLIDKFEQFTMNYYIMQHPEDVSCCPTPGCNYVFVYEEGDNYYECPICEKEYCLKCKSDWHKDKTCQEFQEYRRVGLLGKDQKQLDNLFYDFAKGSKFKQCPYCKNWVEKNEGCNHIACRCGNHFCYFCGEGINGKIMTHVCGKINENNDRLWRINFENNIQRDHHPGLWKINKKRINNDDNNPNHARNRKKMKYLELKKKKRKGKK